MICNFYICSDYYELSKENQIRELESQWESTRSEIESAESLKARKPRLDEMKGRTKMGGLGPKRTAI